MPGDFAAWAGALTEIGKCGWTSEETERQIAPGKAAVILDFWQAGPALTASARCRIRSP
jgi:hypothetical protein